MAALLTDYFPHASSGRKIAMVVPGKADAAGDAGPDPVVASASATTPIPRARPGAAVAPADPTATGSLTTAEATPIADLNTEEGDGGDDDVGTDQPVDNAMVPAGWKIQIAASPTQAGASAMLKKASSTAPKLLGKMSGYTEPVAKGSMTLYRARFGGFNSMQAAQNVCSALARQKVSCFAVQ
jgi:hypothetical protein